MSWRYLRLVERLSDLCNTGRSNRCIKQTRSIPRVLHRFVDQGHLAGNGTADPGQEDCHHRVDSVEEKSVLRRPTSETTNSLSVSDRVRSILGIFSGVGRRVHRDTLVRERVSADFNRLLEHSQRHITRNLTEEIQLDGYRAQVINSDGKLILFSRRRKSFNRQFPLIVEALGDLPENTVIDGEVVALDESGRPDFNMLQNFRSPASRMYYFVFNLPVREGRDLTRLPLIERREIMRSVLKFSSPRIRISDYVEASATTCSTLFSSKDWKGLSGKEKTAYTSPEAERHLNELAVRRTPGGMSSHLLKCAASLRYFKITSAVSTARWYRSVCQP